MGKAEVGDQQQHLLNYLPGLLRPSILATAAEPLDLKYTSTSFSLFILFSQTGRVNQQM